MDAMKTDGGACYDSLLHEETDMAEWTLAEDALGENGSESCNV